MSEIIAPAMIGLILDGMVRGSILAVSAIGLTIIFGLMGIVNFSHGAFYALGAYIGLSLIQYLGNFAGFFIALLVAPLIAGIIGYIVEKTLIRRIYTRDGILPALLLTFGLMLAIHGMLKLFWGVSQYSLSEPEIMSIAVPVLNYPFYRLFAILVSAIAIMLIWLLLHETDIGLIIRSATSNRKMTRALGINIDRTFSMVFALGVGVAALGGILHAPIVGASPDMGIRILIQSFVVVVIGGLNSFRGSIIAALLIGQVQTLAFVVWSPMTDVIIFVLMAVILILRPQGLLGKELGGVN